MNDTILFIVSDDVTDETILAVLAALQSYRTSSIAMNNGWNKLHQLNNKLEMRLHIVCANEEYHILFNRCLADVVKIYNKLSDVPTIEFTYICELSIETARRVGYLRPLAQALGILIGAEAQTLPNVLNLCEGFEINIETLLSPGSDMIFVKHLPEAQSITTGTDWSLLQRAEFVFRAKQVMGHSSFETYLASALGKPVLEIQPSMHLHKWDNKNYICIRDASNEAALKKGIRECFQVTNRGKDV